MATVSTHILESPRVPQMGENKCELKPGGSLQEKDRRVESPLFSNGENKGDSRGLYCL